MDVRIIETCMYTTLTYLINTVFCVPEAGAMESSRTDLTTTLLRISRSRFIYGYHMRLPTMIARLAELTGELASSTSDGLSERVVKNAVWTTIAAAVSIRELVRLWAQRERNSRQFPLPEIPLEHDSTKNAEPKRREIVGETMLKVSTEEINTAQSRDDDGDVTGVTVVEQGEASRDSDNNDEDDELEQERERWRPRAIFRGGLTRQHCTIANDVSIVY